MLSLQTRKPQTSTREFRKVLSRLSSPNLDRMYSTHDYHSYYSRISMAEELFYLYRLRVEIHRANLQFYLMTNLTHNSFLYMFISILYMFRAFKCSSSGDSILSIRYLVYVTLYELPSGMCRFGRKFRPILHTRR